MHMVIIFDITKAYILESKHVQECKPITSHYYKPRLL